MYGMCDSVLVCLRSADDDGIAIRDVHGVTDSHERDLCRLCLLRCVPTENDGVNYRNRDMDGVRANEIPTCLGCVYECNRYPSYVQLRQARGSSTDSASPVRRTSRTG